MGKLVYTVWYTETLGGEISDERVLAKSYNVDEALHLSELLKEEYDGGDVYVVVTRELPEDVETK